MTGRRSVERREFVPELLTVRRAARMLDAKERCVRHWIHSRQLGYVKLGGRVRIPRTELDRFIAAGARPAVVHEPTPDFKSLAAGEREE
jgi:excisionase family DNA binding protein